MLINKSKQHIEPKKKKNEIQNRKRNKNNDQTYICIYMLFLYIYIYKSNFWNFFNHILTFKVKDYKIEHTDTQTNTII